MKKYISALAICFVTLVGCENDPLDQTPSGRLDVEMVFNDVILTRNYLASVYHHLPDYFDRYFFFATLAPKSDEAADSDIGTESWSSARWNAGQLSNNPLMPFMDANRTNGYWDNHWAAIRRANVFLANIDNVAAMSVEERAMLKGEAMALRAYYYAELMKYYGGVPIITTELPTATDFHTITRASHDECAQFVAQQCTEAAELMNTRIRRSSNELGRVSKSFALALKSRTLLYNASPLHNPSNDVAKWEQAANAAREVLALAEEGHLGLHSDYRNLFLMQERGEPGFKEIIFQIPRNNGHFNNTNAIPFANGFKAGTLPSQELVDAYPMLNGERPILGYQDENHLQPIINPAANYDPSNPYANRDPRLTASIFYNGSVWGGPTSPRPHIVETFVGGADGFRENHRSYTRTGYYIKKWINPDAGNGIAGQAGSAPTFWTVFRLAEFYLNFAEAKNEQSGPTPEVYAAVNAIRNRAGIAPLIEGSLTKDVMRETIRNERRVELAFEEHRFFDVRRWKILDKTDKVITGMRITRTGANLIYQRVLVETRNAWQDRYLLLPININELARMNGVTQNPGW